MGVLFVPTYYELRVCCSHILNTIRSDVLLFLYPDDTLATSRFVRHIQLAVTSAYLGEAANVSSLSDLVGDVISSQVVDMVAGQNTQEVSSEYFRLSTGVYDAAAVGGIQVTVTVMVLFFVLAPLVPLLIFQLYALSVHRT